MSVRAYECHLKGEERIVSTVHALTAGKARYVYLLHIRECCPDVKITDIRVRSCGPPRTSERLLRVAEMRGLPFVRAGMKVEADGHQGVIVDGNDSANFDVLFTDGPYKGQVGNCHPWWKVTYFGSGGKVLAKFEEGKGL